MNSNPFEVIQSFDVGDGKIGRFYSLPALEAAGIGPVSRLPVCLRLVLESVLRHCDGQKITQENVRRLVQWQPRAARTEEIPFRVARIVLQDFTGVPLLVDLAAMRSAVARLGRNPKLIEPSVPVDLVVDHSVQVDFAGTDEALERNLELEFRRNRERYQLLKWGMQAFDTFHVVPPGIGIVHQVNLEYLARGVLGGAEDIYYPDTLVGTDSHTTMINGLGIVGWGVGGIEAEAGMLGQPIHFLTPDVVGVRLTGSLREGVTATDVALTVTEMLRRAKVVGKFVEFFGDGAAALPVVDRATIANMAPEYGATMGFFPIDEESLAYLRLTGRSDLQCRLYESYYRAQGLFGMPRSGQIEYSTELELNLGLVVPSVAGPKRPQDRIDLPALKQKFQDLLRQPISESGYGKSESDLEKEVQLQPRSEASEGRAEPGAEVSTKEATGVLRHGCVVIAAITSCTNTSNPSVMVGAGLLAQKAVERGLRVPSWVKTSLAPGSRVVTDYLRKTGLQPYLDQLGFNLVGYGCTTCIGNSGPLPSVIEETLQGHDLIAASVLSGNRNFEARVHQSVKANFLMSPPLVVAFALAGRVDVDLTCEPIGKDLEGRAVYLRDLWPDFQEIRERMQSALSAEVFRQYYRDFAEQNPKWNDVPANTGLVYQWDPRSTYIQEPPFFIPFEPDPAPVSTLKGGRALAIFGDSVTTDHISPAGAIKKSSPAGKYLVEQGVNVVDFNSYGSRRGNDRVMTRGTFANVRIKNLMVPGVEGGVTRFAPSGEVMSIYEAACRYADAGIPLLVFAGQEYGTGSSRDWAAKGTRLLGVRAVVAQSFERIHRSNLVGMGVLPLQFEEETNVQTLRLDGSETFDLAGLEGEWTPRMQLAIRLHRANGKTEEVGVVCRLDTAVEVDYYRHGGILPYVLRDVLKQGR